MRHVYRKYQNNKALIIFLPDDFIKNVIHENRIKATNPHGHAQREVVYKLDSNDILASYFYSVLSYFSQNNPPSKLLLKKKFEELIISILSTPRNDQLAAYFNELYANSKIPLKEIMENNFYYNLKLEEFARLSGRSLSTFRRDFEKAYRTTPSRWLTSRRLEYGKYLLENTDKSIGEITLDAGFENPSHFIRIFKAKYQTSPYQFKQTV